jgi:hypothetical protein
MIIEIIKALSISVIKKMKNSNNDNRNNKGTIIIGDANNTGNDIIVPLCSDILDTIYESTNNDDYSLTRPFKEQEKIDFIDNRIIRYKQPLKEFWRSNQQIENIILLKNKNNPHYAGRIYGRFKALYDDHKTQFIEQNDFGDLVIDFIIKEIKAQIKEFHNLTDFNVGDLHDGIRSLAFHAFYKCKILENPNDSK